MVPGINSSPEVAQFPVERFRAFDGKQQLGSVDLNAANGAGDSGRQPPGPAPLDTRADSATASMLALTKPSAVNRSIAACTIAARVVSAYSSRRPLALMTADPTHAYVRSLRN
jgi:hypothetical protein